MEIERGWFYLADLSSHRGTEPGKMRPVLVIQTDLLNSAGHPSTVIIPLTTNVQEDAEPLCVRIPATAAKDNHSINGQRLENVSEISLTEPEQFA